MVELLIYMLMYGFLLNYIWSKIFNIYNLINKGFFIGILIGVFRYIIRYYPNCIF